MGLLPRPTFSHAPWSWLWLLDTDKPGTGGHSKVHSAEKPAPEYAKQHAYAMAIKYSQQIRDEPTQWPPAGAASIVKKKRGHRIGVGSPATAEPEPESNWPDDVQFNLNYAFQFNSLSTIALPTRVPSVSCQCQNF